MYFPIGWPKILALPTTDRDQVVLKVAFDREKFMFAVLNQDSLGIWFNNVSCTFPLPIYHFKLSILTLHPHPLLALRPHRLQCPR